MGKVPEVILEMLRAADSKNGVFPKTLLFNEGWMLRLVLSMAARGIDCLPFSISRDARWFSEPQLNSHFLSRHHGDELAETRSHADGVVGHFRVTPGTKVGVEILPAARQFIVLEAKMYSSLRAGTKNAPFYDQAARTVACMASTLEHSGRLVNNLDSVGFYVVAPEEKIKEGIFDEQMELKGIARKVERRIEQYRNDKEKMIRLQTGFQTTFRQLIERIDLGCWSWEAAVKAISSANAAEGDDVAEFYRRCVLYNRPKKVG